MADVVVTLRIMPEGPEVDLTMLQESATKDIAAFGGEVGRVQIEPVGFGIQALKLFFVMPESKGSTDPLEATIAKIGGVGSVSVDDVRRTIG